VSKPSADLGSGFDTLSACGAERLNIEIGGGGRVVVIENGLDGLVVV